MIRQAIAADYENGTPSGQATLWVADKHGQRMAMFICDNKEEAILEMPKKLLELGGRTVVVNFKEPDGETLTAYKLDVRVFPKQTPVSQDIKEWWKESSLKKFFKTIGFKE